MNVIKGWNATGTYFNGGPLIAWRLLSRMTVLRPRSYAGIPEGATRLYE